MDTTCIYILIKKKRDKVLEMFIFLLVYIWCDEELNYACDLYFLASQHMQYMLLLVLMFRMNKDKELIRFGGHN